jgi:hypothetical protein
MVKFGTLSTLVVVAVAGLTVIELFFPTMIWDGAIMRSVTITVLESGGHSPVSGATAILMRHGSETDFEALPEQERQAWIADLTHGGMAGTTGADGSVTLRSHFPAGGHSFLFRRTGSYGIAGTLMIARQGVICYSESLEHLIPAKKRSLNDELPPISVSLP